MVSVNIRTLCRITRLPISTLRTYLGHYTLHRHRAKALNVVGKRCIGYELSEEFLNDFEYYLIIVKGRKFSDVVMRSLRRYKDKLDNVDTKKETV